MSQKHRVDQLDSAIIEEVLGLDQATLITLVTEAEVSAVRTDLQVALAAAGKLKLARAKSSVALHRAGHKIGPVSIRSGVSRVQTLRQQDRLLDQKLTLAARSGTADAAADAESLEEDLSELDAWEIEDRGST